MVKIKIHRGTHQIGGSVVEIKTEKSRIFVDFGEELPPVGGKEKQSGSPLEIEGLTKGKANCGGLFFTHAHGDHMGMYQNVLEDVPLYMGEASKEIYLCIQNRVKFVKPEISEKLKLLENARTFKAKDEIKVGDITVKPYFVDHSAYDAYMFLIEAEGKKILHTGDFRTHGFRGKGVEKMLDYYVKNVDLLICEGTMLSRSGDEQNVLSEAALMKQLDEYYSQAKYVFLMCSSTNIDRIAAAYSKIPKLRYFLCDGYQKDVLNIVEKYGAQKSNGFYKFTIARDYTKIDMNDAIKKGFCMLVRPTDKFAEIMEPFKKENSIVLYSMWKGYLEQYSKYLDGFRYEYWHTSGHATPNALKTVCDTVKPNIGVVPIHTEAPEELARLVSPYRVLNVNDNDEIII